MNLIQTLDTISPALASVVVDGWGCDVHAETDKPGWVGDTEWAHIHFKPTLSRDQVAAIATLINNAPRMLQLLRNELVDGECYCTPKSEGGSNEACNHCQIKSLIGGGPTIASRDSIGTTALTAREPDGGLTSRQSEPAPPSPKPLTPSDHGSAALTGG